MKPVLDTSLRARATALSACLLSLATPSCSVGSPDDASSKAEALTPVVMHGAPWGFDTAWDITSFPANLSDPTHVPQPAATALGNGRIDVFMRGSNGELYQMLTSPATGWNGWNMVDHVVARGLASDPSASASSGAGQLSVVWRNADNTVTHFHWDPWNNWRTDSLGGGVEGRPTVVYASDGSRRDVFARAGGEVWHIGWTPSDGWSPWWENLHLKVDSDPVAASSSPGQIAIFARATDGTIKGYLWDGQSFNQPQPTHPFKYVERFLYQAAWTTTSLPRWSRGAPAVGVTRTGYQVFMQGGDDQIWSSTQVSGGWTPWAHMGGACTLGTPAVASWSTGADDREDLFALDTTSGRLFHTSAHAYPSSTPGAAPACCGASEQHSCAGPSQTQWGAACKPGLGTNSVTGVCKPCGSTGDVCCDDPNARCTDGSSCANPHVGYHYCGNCGKAGLPACITASDPHHCSASDHAIYDAASDQCVHCGDLDEVACPGSDGIYQCSTTISEVPDYRLSNPDWCSKVGCDCGPGTPRCTTPTGAEHRCKTCGYLNEQACVADVGGRAVAWCPPYVGGVNGDNTHGVFCRGANPVQNGPCASDADCLAGQHCSSDRCTDDGGGGGGGGGGGSSCSQPTQLSGVFNSLSCYDTTVIPQMSLVLTDTTCGPLSSTANITILNSSGGVVNSGSQPVNFPGLYTKQTVNYGQELPPGNYTFNVSIADGKWVYSVPFSVEQSCLN